jgi:hypothetical protein
MLDIIMSLHRCIYYSVIQVSEIEEHKDIYGFIKGPTI